jgi:DNA-binding ferritin-like protein (Dps family)
MNRLINKLKRISREKAEYKEHIKLVKSLPEDYQYVYHEIRKYIWSLDYTGSMMNVLMDTLEAFSIAAVDGRDVLSVTGEDVGVFCDGLLKKFNAKTWADKCREKLNKNIQKKLGAKMDPPGGTGTPYQCREA